MGILSYVTTVPLSHLPPKKMNSNVLMYSSFSKFPCVSKNIQRRYGKILVVESTWWVYGYSLYYAFKVSVYYEIYHNKDGEKKNKRHTGCFSPGSSSLPYHHHGELLFYKTLLLVIHTHNFPRGTISLLTQKMFMVS